MSKINDVGYSEYTQIKQKHFKEIIKVHLACTAAILKKWPFWAENRYYYFDINAGPGIVEGKWGSPLIFLNQIQKYPHLNFSIILIEKNLNNWEKLNDNIAGFLKNKNLSIEIRKGEHNDILPQYFVNQKKNRFGLLYADPSGNIPSFDLLKAISCISCYSKLDLLINCPCATIKRAGPRNPITQGQKLEDYLSAIDKNFWLIRELYHKHQFTFLIGTNWIHFPSFRKIKLYPTDSAEGAPILYQANNTKSEIEEDTHEMS